MSKIKLVLIDIDDTLCLTEKTSFDTENRIAVQMGFSPMSRENHIKNWGKRIQEAIVERVPGIAVTEFMDRFVAENAKLVSQGMLDSLSENNINTLKVLKDMGKPMAIVTSRTHGEVKHFLSESHIIQNYITDFYYDGNLKYLKPDPRVFQEILAKFEVNSDEALYIGDSVTDAMCAKSANLHFIAVLEGKIRQKADFDGIDVDFFVNTFKDIISYEGFM